MRVKKLNEESVFTKAWMINNRGKAEEVEIHIQFPYVKETDKIYTVDCWEKLVWYYNRTNKDEVKEEIINLFKLIIRDKAGIGKGKILSKLKELGFTDTKKISRGGWHGDCLEIYNIIAADFNQEFLKARVGGMYFARDDNTNDIFFRVSSQKFNWINIIYKFVIENYKKLNIKYVTICRDEEVNDGKQFFYYEKGKGQFNRMPIDEFLSYNGNPVIEKFDKKCLENGDMIWESYGKYNPGRIIKEYRGNLVEEIIKFSNDQSVWNYIDELNR